MLCAMSASVDVSTIKCLNRPSQMPSETFIYVNQTYQKHMCLIYWDFKCITNMDILQTWMSEY